MDKFLEIGNTPIDFSVLESMFPDYKSVHNKIGKLEKAGKIIRLKKGLYVVSPKESGKLLSTELIANHIYGPSYVSMESALRYYGLIPESVYTIRSMVIKHTKSFNNMLGKFEYTECPKNYFPIGIKQESNADATFLIATPEKALCDLIAYTPNLNLRFQKETSAYLEEGLRLDMDAFYHMNIEIFKSCAEVGKKKKTLNILIKLLQS